MSLSNQVLSVRVNTLKIGQKFVKVRMGSPCLTQYQYLGSFGGMVKCTRLKDSSPFLLPDYVLVYKLKI